MVGENTNHELLDALDPERSPLLPDRHPTTDLFVCDIFDAAPKGDMASMEHPIFSLSTKPDRRVRRYEHGHAWIEITPSVKGLATVHDRDVLIYCISQTIAALNEGKPVSKRLRLRAYDVLTATNRLTDGRGYDGLKAALERLLGTKIVTNITTGNREELDGFGLINSFKLVRQTREGRMQELEIELSDWVFNAIRAKEVLTLHRDYFRLRKPLERRMYELARKHCGTQAEWRIHLERLQKKCGSNSTLKEFRRLVGTIIAQDMEHQHFPDYSVSFDDDMVVFRNRVTMPALMRSAAAVREDEAALSLAPDTFDRARAVAGGYDVQWLYEQWQEFWCMNGKPELKNPDAAFIGFCKARAEKYPLPR